MRTDSAYIGYPPPQNMQQEDNLMKNINAFVNYMNERLKDDAAYAREAYGIDATFEVGKMADDKLLFTAKMDGKPTHSFPLDASSMETLQQSCDKLNQLTKAGDPRSTAHNSVNMLMGNALANIVDAPKTAILMDAAFPEKDANIVWFGQVLLPFDENFSKEQYDAFFDPKAVSFETAKAMMEPSTDYVLNINYLRPELADHIRSMIMDGFTGFGGNDNLPAFQLKFDGKMDGNTINWKDLNAGAKEYILADMAAGCPYGNFYETPNGCVDIISYEPEARSSLDDLISAAESQEASTSHETRNRNDREDR